MRVRLLLSAAALCVLTSGCETVPNEAKQAAQPANEPVYRTGSRLPAGAYGAVQDVSREGWDDDMRRAPSQPGIYR